MSKSVATYKAIAVSASGELELVSRPLVDPVGTHVRARVEACGICHTDAVSVTPHPDSEPGVVPGHEVIGVIDAVGADVSQWAIGDRVGVGFLGGHCGHCSACRRGDFVHCTDQPKTGVDVDGGYAEYLITRESALVAVPDALSSVNAAPLLCAGLTTYNALVGADIRPGSTVVIQGVGGLGHLGIQYADKMGMTTIAIARGTEKEALSRELGADEYLDANDVDSAVEKLSAHGGVDLIVATASSGAAASALISALATNGRITVVGASPEPITVGTGDLIGRGIQVSGSLTGSAIDNEDNLEFAARQGISPIIEEYSLERASDAFARMLRGDARFRIVLIPE